MKSELIIALSQTVKLSLFACTVSKDRGFLQNILIYLLINCINIIQPDINYITYMHVTGTLMTSLHNIIAHDVRLHKSPVGILS